MRELHPLKRSDIDFKNRAIHVQRNVVKIIGKKIFNAESISHKKSVKSCDFTDFLVRPTGFEPAAFRVGVIRPSSRKALRRKGLIGVAQISGILRKKLGSLTGQGFRGFSR